MNTYFTYFDNRYLLHGIALITSLRRVGDNSPVHILALDPETFLILSELKTPGLHITSLDQLERFDSELLAKKSTRKLVEYYFTLTSCYASFLMQKGSVLQDTLLTYIDADLYFFSSTESYFAEVGAASIAITPHNFSNHLAYLAIHGTYNVGILSWRKDSVGIACINRYREQCLEWCFDRVEGDKFGDQKYLNSWPQDFSDVIEITKSHVNISYWNIGRFKVSVDNSIVLLDNTPIIAWHFSGFKRVAEDSYVQKHFPDEIRTHPALIDFVFKPYAKELVFIKKTLESRQPGSTAFSQSLRG